MSDLIKLESLEEIEDKYNIFFIDLWGVVHNGLELFENVKTVLKRLRKNMGSRLQDCLIQIWLKLLN